MRTVFAGTQLFVPHVPQELFREWLPREFHQQFDDVCIFGMIVVPMIHDGVAIGGIAVMRERADQPFTLEDADTMGRLSVPACDVVLAARLDGQARVAPPCGGRDAGGGRPGRRRGPGPRGRVDR